MANEAPPHHPTGAGLEPVSLGEAWQLIAPWLGHALLAAAAVFGLLVASGAPDSATYDSGMATFVVAVAIIAIRIKRQLDGAYIGVLLPIAVTREDSLYVSIAVLAALGLAGAILADFVGGAFYGIGLALFVLAAALIFSNIKHYFDFRERRG
ncbi:MAG TPA: hypothetical protein VN832_09145 [Stellaceae bacterium]|nr:hypothetical protein [Stellaceae bacterium]